MNVPTRTRRPARGPLLSRTATERIVLAVVVSVSVVAIWGSVARYRNLQLRTITLQKQLSHLQGDLDLMNSRWPDGRRRETDRRFSEVRDHLFKGQQSLAAWMDEIRHGAPPLALAAEVTVTNTRTETNGPTPLTVVQAQVDMPVSTDIEAHRPPYQRLIQFGQQLASTPQRVDLIEASLTAGDAAPTVATAVVEVWTSQAPSATP